MSSTITYTKQTIPYFYIIRHIASEKLYAGSRWAKGCNPLEFMQLEGYTTSSSTINFIIESEGLNSFEILRIDTNCDGFHVYDYETSFLQCNDCAASPNWLNGHNNKGITFGTEQFIKSMLLKYDDEYFNNREKMKLTKLKNHGNENYTNREKAEQTNFKNTGYKSALQNPKSREKGKETVLLKYGDVNYRNLEKAKNTMLLNYGVDHSSKIKFLCIIESKKEYSKQIISRDYPEFKQYY